MKSVKDLSAQEKSDIISKITALLKDLELDTIKVMQFTRKTLSKGSEKLVEAIVIDEDVASNKAE
jgi:hypothetical protein